MAAQRRSAKRSATDRLAQLVEGELERQGLNGEQAAREARLPANSFRGLLLKRQRPSIDRADELCEALGITMTIRRSRATEDTSDTSGKEAAGSARK